MECGLAIRLGWSRTLQEATPHAIQGMTVPLRPSRHSSERKQMLLQRETCVEGSAEGGRRT
jgi:hypothetical protein